MQSKKNKPVGSEKILKIGNGKASVGKHKLKGTKEEIESFFANLFFSRARKEKNFPFTLSKPPKRNEENDLDFSLEVDGKNSLLELMEIAPLESSRGGHSNVPVSYSLKERCEFIRQKISRKANRYWGIKSDIFLLLYSTNWKLSLTPFEFRALSKIFHRESYQYKAIFYISWFPGSPENDGEVHILFPANISPYFSQPEVVGDQAMKLDLDDFSIE
ncbi:MAG: hypothetical protein JRJ03_18480 [Deltaproteobacteria bacterium]|nr:hypothetical protein [Deltaproteobacteria bacterium]